MPTIVTLYASTAANATGTKLEGACNYSKNELNRRGYIDNNNKGKLVRFKIEPGYHMRVYEELEGEYGYNEIFTAGEHTLSNYWLNNTKGVRRIKILPSNKSFYYNEPECFQNKSSSNHDNTNNYLFIVLIIIYFFYMCRK